VILLDMAIYWQHRILHMHPLLWRLHRTHHRDEAMDLTTGVRFHPGEIAVSALWKAAAVVAVGASPVAVIVFETILTSASLWEHANIRLSERTDRRLRHLLVTPAMHLVHHGRDGDDMRTNFGFSTSLWDRLFNSYRQQATSTRLGAE
jgi:sterol desaturase/sphingolipid hydroxylase (fatty acid hydroxylase superfamily)